MSKSSTLEIISIDKIEISVTNPRKSFENKSFNELVESIKEHGVLQPILVRLNVEGSMWTEDYQLVCGERRYRAAKMAGLDVIPAMIQVLTDDEAFELQIIENLERKDVHPLEESDAFKKMLDSGKYTIADIAAKMAKPESFIVQRLKLVDLIEPIRTDFIAGHLGIGHAILIARCDEFKQLDIHKDSQPYNEHYPTNYGTIHDLKETIEDDSTLLSEAEFSLSDAKLTDACACDVCPKRSGSNPVLFEDMQEDRCFDEVCFKNKTEAFIEIEVAEIINEGTEIFILAQYAKPSDVVTAFCKQYGIKILIQYEDWNNREIDGWPKKEGFIVSGSDKGKYVEFYLKPGKENETQTEAYSSTGSKAPISNEIRELKEQISNIETRADRAVELDGEKVWAKIRAIDTSEIKTIIGGLFEVEVNAVCLAMISKLSWEAQKQLKEKVGDFKLETIQERDFTKFEFNQIQRIFFLDVLPSSFGNYYSNVSNYAYTKALMHYESDKINEIIANQKAISDVRMDKADTKIKELKAKIEKLQPVAEPKKEAPERIEDKVETKHFSSEIKQFDKVDKKYALNNSYFKNRKNSYPANPLEVAMYHEQHGTLPFDYSGTDWLYETYIEYQKRNSVYHSQFFTPPATALRMAEIANQYFEEGDPYILDACCGFGMLTKPLTQLGFIVIGIDSSQDMVEMYAYNTSCDSELTSFQDYRVHNKYKNVIANPPYEIPVLTEFLESLHNVILEDFGVAILLLPKGFIDKDKPKALVSILDKFKVIHREDMLEDFARTGIKAEIVVLEKA